MPLWVSATCRDVVLQSRPLSLADDEVVFVIEDAIFEQMLGEVRVRVVDRATQIPIEKGVELSHQSGGVRATGSCVDGT